MSLSKQFTQSVKNPFQDVDLSAMQALNPDHPMLHLGEKSRLPTGTGSNFERQVAEYRYDGAASTDSPEC
jgi:hypothetical protein